MGPHLKQRGSHAGPRRATIHVGTEWVKVDLELCPNLRPQLASQPSGRLCQLLEAPPDWPASATQPEAPALMNWEASQSLGEGHRLWRRQSHRESFAPMGHAIGGKANSGPVLLSPCTYRPMAGADLQ